MEHITDQDLERYCFGTIEDANELARIRNHLIACEDCLDRFEDIEFRLVVLCQIGPSRQSKFYCVIISELCAIRLQNASAYLIRRQQRGPDITRLTNGISRASWRTPYRSVKILNTTGLTYVRGAVATQNGLGLTLARA